MHLLNRQQANTGSLSRNMSNIRFYYWQHRVPHNKQSLLRMKTYQPDENDDNDNIQPTTNLCEKLSHCTRQHRIYTYTCIGPNRLQLYVSLFFLLLHKFFLYIATLWCISVSVCVLYKRAPPKNSRYIYWTQQNGEWWQGKRQWNTLMHIFANATIFRNISSKKEYYNEKKWANERAQANRSVG